MPTARPDARQRLLDRTIEYLAVHGSSELSLRRLASALGTSHRMLIYHFGSKDGLLVEVARTMEQRERDIFTDLGLAPGTDPGVAMRAMHQQLSAPQTWPYMRLFFELYGRGLQGDPTAGRLLDGLVEHWIDLLAGFIRQQGVDQQTARTDARIALALARGLALDLLTTGDRAGVDLAAERFLSGLEQRWSTEVRPSPGQRETR